MEAVVGRMDVTGYFELREWVRFVGVVKEVLTVVFTFTRTSEGPGHRRNPFDFGSLPCLGQVSVCRSSSRTTNLEFKTEEV